MGVGGVGGLEVDSGVVCFCFRRLYEGEVGLVGFWIDWSWKRFGLMGLCQEFYAALDQDDTCLQDFNILP